MAERRKLSQKECRTMQLLELDIKEKMQIDDQLIIIATNPFFTALKSSFRKSGKENWNQFIYIYNYGYFDKRKIRREILRLFLEKIRNRG